MKIFMRKKHRSILMYNHLRSKSCITSVSNINLDIKNL